MAIQTKAQIAQDIIDGVLTGGSRTKAVDVRGILNSILDSYPNIQDGGMLFVPQVGYATNVTISDNRAFAHKKYVDDAISAVSGITGTGPVNQILKIITSPGGNVTVIGPSSTSDDGEIRNTILESATTNAYNRLFLDSRTGNTHEIKAQTDRYDQTITYKSGFSYSLSIIPLFLAGTEQFNYNNVLSTDQRSVVITKTLYNSVSPLGGAAWSVDIYTQNNSVTAGITIEGDGIGIRNDTVASSHRIIGGTVLITSSDVCNTNGGYFMFSSITTAVELEYLSGVTSNVQTQFNDIATTYLPLAGGTLVGNLNGVTPTEITYLSGATSNLQTQINNINSGLSWKTSVRAATTANITLSGAQTIDGVSVIAGDRVLVKNQSTASQNGIYVVASGSWTRSTDTNTGAKILQATTSIEEGTVNGDTIYTCTTNAPITIGSSSINFAKTSATTYTGSDGITLSGNNFQLDNSYFSGAFTLSAGVATLATVGANKGGTGVANNASSTWTISGNFGTTVTVTGTTTVTLPTTGTLATLAGAEAFTNKTYNGNTWTAGTGTLTISAGKTLTVSNTYTTTATDGSTIAFGAGGTVAYVANKLSAFAATTSAELAGVISDEIGYSSGAFLVFSISPTLTTPNIGVATATSVNKVAITAPATSATLTLIDGTTITGPASTSTLLANNLGISGGSTLIGGTAVGDKMIFKATSFASNTASTSLYKFISSGTTSVLEFGDFGGAGDNFFYSAQSSPSNSNYWLRATASVAYFNAVTDLRMQIGANSIIVMSSSSISLRQATTMFTAMIFTYCAGTTTVAPVGYQSGSLLTTIAAAKGEYNNAYYFTNSNLNRFPIGGPIADFNTDANNSGTGETDLYTYTTKASTLGANGEKIKALFSGTFNDVTATNQLKVYFAGTAIADTGALTISATGSWVVEVLIIRVSSTVVRYSVNISTTGASTAAYASSGELTSLTLSNTNIIKITGTAAGATGGSSDITAKSGVVEWWAAAANT